MVYEVHGNEEKVYVHHIQYGCVARLCTMSAEYYGVKENFINEMVVEYIDTKFKSTFKEFQEKCHELYNVVVTDDYCPMWAK